MARKSRTTGRPASQTGEPRWLRDALHGAGLRGDERDPERGRLEAGVGGLLMSVLASHSVDPAERRQLETTFSEVVDPSRARQALRELAVDFGARLGPGDARRAGLAGAALGLLVLDQRACPNDMWRREDLRLLQRLEEWRDLPRMLAAVLSITKRHPAASTTATVEAEVLAALRASQDPSWRRPDPVEAMFGGIVAALAQPAPTGKSAERVYLFDLDADDARYLVLNDRRLAYGGLHRGGKLTTAHRAARLLVDIYEGRCGAHSNTSALKDLRAALKRATTGELTIRREGDTHTLSGPVSMTERMLRACRARRSGP